MASQAAVNLDLDADRVLTKQEAAKVLKLSTETLDRFARKGIGPPRAQVGGQVRYRLSRLLEWLDGQVR